MILPYVLLLLPLAVVGQSAPGAVILDEWTFDKVVTKHDVVLVKIDQMYAWGDHLKEWQELIERLRNHDRLLLAEIKVADFGDRQGAKLAERFGVKTVTYEYPQYRLFLKNKGLEPIVYQGNNDADDLTKFIVMSSGIWMPLPGCLPDFDHLIRLFLNKTLDEQNGLIRAGEKMMNEVGNLDKPSAETYVKVMKRLVSVEGGIDEQRSLLEEEMKRTDRIVLFEQAHQQKVEALKEKMNIIGSFFFNGMPTWTTDLETKVERPELMKDEL